MGKSLSPRIIRFMRIPARKIARVGVALVSVLLCVTVARAADLKPDQPPLPELRKVGQVTQLYVQGKPFLALGGELGNSTPSDLTVLEDALAKCQWMNLNTIMLPVYWDRIEPEEGIFDFTLV